jgi:hypothetical protein
MALDGLEAENELASDVGAIAAGLLT